MTRSAVGAVLCLVALAMPQLAVPAAPATTPGLQLPAGMDHGAVATLTAAGAPPAYATVWVGVWNVRGDWAKPTMWLTNVTAAGVTPVVQAWYWGDDIHPRCFDEGCRDKTVEEWDRYLTELAAMLNATAGGGRVIVVLEPEFNKHTVSDWEPLDAVLAERARFLKASYPSVVVVLGFGNWKPEKWPTWDRAVAAADWTGIQAMKASTRNDDASYRRVAVDLLEGVRELRRFFGKPVLITDVALSSYPDPGHRVLQAEALANISALEEAFVREDVQGILYRHLHDDPEFDEDNWFGEAERYWGLVAADGTPKAALDAWVAAFAPASPAPEGPPEAESAPRDGGDASSSTRDHGAWLVLLALVLALSLGAAARHARRRQ